jgi:solute carrier family 25 thiamine pyrophosphate transporter 19
MNSSNKGSKSDNLIAGAFAGATARLVTSPLDILKIRYQLQYKSNIKYKSLYQSLSTIIKEEGVLSLWKGNLSASYLWVSYSMVQFSVYSYLQNKGNFIPEYINNNNNEKYISIWISSVNFFSGATAGIISSHYDTFLSKCLSIYLSIYLQELYQLH